MAAFYPTSVLLTYYAMAACYSADHAQAKTDLDARKEPVYPRVAIGRNQKCPCGSGAKFKRCCMRTNNAR